MPGREKNGNLLKKPYIAPAENARRGFGVLKTGLLFSSKKGALAKPLARVGCLLFML
jgi:hypothetical protein